MAPTLKCICVLLGFDLPEQGMEWLPLDLGMVAADKPTCVIYTCIVILKSIVHSTGNIYCIKFCCILAPSW